MTDFNFLRIKWPKLAAIAADAGRLVEVSPASAISTMQNFCEWAADIALDFYDINTQNGITQQEKLDTLRTTGHVPQEIIERFRSVMLAGGRRLYRDNEDVLEARACIEDVYEIGRWLNKEADRAGWPPKNDYYRPVVSPLGSSGEGGGFSAGRIGQTLSNYKPFIAFGVGAIVVLVLAVWGISSVMGGGGAKPTAVVILTPSPSSSASASMLTATPGPTATPAPEEVIFLDTLTPSTTRETFYRKEWKFQSGVKKLTIGDKQYQNGIGMYIPKKSISKTQGTWTMKFKLNGDYSKLRFDLGVDTMQYGEGYGQYRVQIYCDSDSNDPVYDTNGLKDYTYREMGVEVNISGCQTLIIKLTEKKGTKGTINVVLGDARLVKAGTGESPVVSASAGTSASASAGTGEGEGEGSASASASATASATIDPEAEGEQETTNP